MRQEGLSPTRNGGVQVRGTLDGPYDSGNKSNEIVTMRTKYALFLVSLGLLSFTTYTVAEDIISRLGMKHANVQSHIMANFTGSFTPEFEVRETTFFYPRIPNIKAIIGNDKAAVVRDFCQYVKDYVNSEEFLTEYQARRASAKPTYEPERIDPSSLENMRTVVRDLESQMAELKRSPMENAQAIAVYEPMLANQKATLAEYEDLTPNKTKWEKNYPADPSIVIRRKLQEYLDLVATVDFNAQLTAPDKYHIQKFANPDYERKSAHWKACFRAGKAANDATSLFVKEWMKGEIISGVKGKAPKDTDAASAATRNTSLAPGLSDDTAQDGVQNEAGEGSDAAPKEKASLLGKLKRAKALLKD